MLHLRGKVDFGIVTLWNSDEIGIKKHMDFVFPVLVKDWSANSLTIGSLRNDGGRGIEAKIIGLSVQWGTTLAKGPGCYYMGIIGTSDSLWREPLKNILQADVWKYLDLGTKCVSFSFKKTNFSVFHCLSDSLERRNSVCDPFQPQFNTF